MIILCLIMYRHIFMLVNKPRQNNEIRIKPIIIVIIKPFSTPGSKFAFRYLLNIKELGPNRRVDNFRSSFLSELRILNREWVSEPSAVSRIRVEKCSLRANFFKKLYDIIVSRRKTAVLERIEVSALV